MSIKVKGIYILTNGSWRKVEKVFKDGFWYTIQGIFHNWDWYEIYTGTVPPDPIDPDPYIKVTPTECSFDYNATPQGSNTDRFTLTSKGAWTMSTSWSPGYSNWCRIRTLGDLPISSGSAGTYNLKILCDTWTNPLNGVRSCKFIFSSNGNSVTYTVTQADIPEV